MLNSLLSLGAQVTDLWTASLLHSLLMLAAGAQAPVLHSLLMLAAGAQVPVLHSLLLLAAGAQVPVLHSLLMLVALGSRRAPKTLACQPLGASVAEAAVLTDLSRAAKLQGAVRIEMESQKR